MIILEKGFYIAEISDEIFEKMKGKSYKENCIVPVSDLRYVHVCHKDIGGNALEGEIVCHKVIAEDVLEIFKGLYKAGYPVEKVRLIDEYNAEDELSMRDNNSSSFNFRYISYSTDLSKHALGLAVDINTLYNPYTKFVNGKRTIEPATAEPYLDRKAEFPYKIKPDDLCCKLFKNHGFEWGGDWEGKKDYQHFELPDYVVEKIKNELEYFKA